MTPLLQTDGNHRRFDFDVLNIPVCGLSFGFDDGADENSLGKMPPRPEVMTFSPADLGVAVDMVIDLPETTPIVVSLKIALTLQLGSMSKAPARQG